MNITEVKIRRIYDTPTSRLRAIVSVVIDHCLALHDLRIVQGADRCFVAMPSEKDENGFFRDIVHPISAHARGQLESVVLGAYYSHIQEHPPRQAGSHNHGHREISSWQPR